VTIAYQGANLDIAINIQIIIFKEGFDLKPISRKGAKAQRRKGAKVEGRDARPCVSWREA